MEEKEKEKVFRITLKESQMRRLIYAADVVSRLICGQMNDFQDICEGAYDRHHKNDGEESTIGTPGWWDARHDLEEKLKDIKMLCWKLGTGSNYGIHYDDFSDSLFDMRKSMEKARYDAFDEERKELMRWTVMRDGHMGLDKDGPIKVELVNE